MDNKKKMFIKKRLKQASVGIAGAGGLGSNAAIALARIGIGKLVIVDHDKIEETNLNRQYYFRDQIGKKKVEALKENIKKINQDVIVITHDLELKKDKMYVPFKDVDVIIEALDKAETKANFIEEILIKLPDKPIIAASGVTGFGNCDRIKIRKIGKLTMCYDEKAKSSEEDILLAPRVCLIANWEADLAIEYILGEKYEYRSE